MPNLFSEQKKSFANKRRLTILISLAFSLSIFGCEKTKTPFSADAIQPPQGNEKIFVTDGTNPTPNVLVNGIDPTGNIFTATTDSTGAAIFNPIPFNPGTWTFHLPNQNHRCFGDDSQSVTLITGTNTQSVTFQYGVFANVISTSSGQLNSGSFPITFFDIRELNTQNDCGGSWVLTYTLTGSSFNWTWGESGLLAPGSSYSVTLVSGQSAPLTLIEYENTSFNSLLTNFNSIIGQCNSFPATF